MRFHRHRDGGTSQCSRTSVLLGRGMQKRKRWQKYNTLQCGFIEHRTRVFQSSINGAVSSWCEEFAHRTPSEVKSTVEKFAAKENE